MDDEERYVHGDDPYAGSADADIRPDFYSLAFDNQDYYDSSKDDDGKYDYTSRDLRNAEKRASRQKSKNRGDGARDMAKAESDVPSDKNDSGFKNNVGAKKDGGAGSGIKGLAGRFGGLGGKLAMIGGRSKKISPLVSIFLFLGCGGGVVYGAQATLPQALLNKYKGIYDSVSVINSVRADTLISKFIRNSSVGWTPETEGERSAEAQAAAGNFTFTDKQEERLNKQGIYLNGEGADADNACSGHGLGSYLCFRKITIAVNDDDNVDQSGCLFEEGDLCDFEYTYANNSKFHLAYNNASATWRTAVTTYTKEAMANYYAYRGISRALVGVASRGVGAITRLVKSKNPGMRSTEVDSTTREESDGNGGTKPHSSDDNKKLVDIDKTKEEFDTDPSTMGAINSGDSRTSRTAAANAMAGKVSKTAAKLAKGAKAVNLVCQALTIGMMIAQLVYANSTYSLLDTAQQFIASLEKALAGDATDLSAFTDTIGRQYDEYYGEQRDGYEKAIVVYDGVSTDDTYDKPELAPSISDDVDPDAFGDSMKDNVSYDPNVKYTGSYMTAPATQTMWSHEVYSVAGDPSAAQFNIFSGLKYLSKAMKMGVSNYRRCTLARIASSALSFAGTLASIAQCFLPPLVGCAASIVENISVRVAAKMALRFVLSFVVTQLIAAFIPKIAQHLSLSFANIIGGSAFANAVKVGFNMLSGQADMYGGASPASEATIGQHTAAREKWIADNARYERELYSPFDIRSSNTFFGSIVDKFIPVTSYVGISLSGGLNSFASLVKSSLSSLAPGASAAGRSINTGNAIESTVKNCPFLESVGAVGDEYCTPYMISDLSTAGSDPVDIIDELYKADQLESLGSGKFKVKEDSRLERWLEFCNRRNSPFGIADQNIASALGVDVDGAAGTAMSYVPLVGDMMSLINDSRALSNAGLITGEACVTGNGSGTYNQVNGTNINARLDYQGWLQERQDLYKEFKEGVAGGDKGALDLLRMQANDAAFATNDATVASQLDDATNEIDQDAYKNKATGEYRFPEQVEYAMIKSVYDAKKNDLSWKYTTLYPQYYKGADVNGHYVFDSIANRDGAAYRGNNGGAESTVYDNGVAFNIYAGKVENPYNFNGPLNIYSTLYGNNADNMPDAACVSAGQDVWYYNDKTYNYDGINFRVTASWSTDNQDDKVWSCDDLGSKKSSVNLSITSDDLNNVVNTCYGDITYKNYTFNNLKWKVEGTEWFRTDPASEEGIWNVPYSCDNSQLVRDQDYHFDLIDPNQNPEAAIAHLDQIESDIRERDKQIYDYEKKNAEEYSFDAIISESGTWNETRFFQRFAQDQRLFEDMGIIQADENIVNEAYARIEEKHPLDNSYLGILSRYSGMTKENVQLALDGAEVIEWIAQYDPAHYAPSPAPVIKEPNHEFEEEQYDTAQYLARVPDVFFEDRRQRNFAA